MIRQLEKLQKLYDDISREIIHTLSIGIDDALLKQQKQLDFLAR